MKYKVGVTETESRCAIVEVEADSEKEACEKAEDVVCGWESEDWEENSEPAGDLVRASQIIKE